MPETISLPLGGALAAMIDFLRAQVTNDAGRVPRHNRIRRHVVHDDRACADDRSFTNRHPRQDANVKPDPGHATDPDRPRRHLRLNAPGTTYYGAFEFPAALQRIERHTV